jgi:hypothetical protein
LTTVERSIPGFLPTTAGFHFANRWPSAPTLRFAIAIPGPVPVEVELRIGDAASGLCGGMALAARDNWTRGEAPPPDREPPAEGSALFREIVGRQIASLELGAAVARFYRASVASDRTRSRVAVREVWPAIRQQIDAGRPALLGLVHVASADPRRLTANHQVLAYGYTLDGPSGRVTLRIYDPNHPDDDTVRLELSLDITRTLVAFGYVPGEGPVIGIVRQR